jgi:hypothetical protein
VPTSKTKLCITNPSHHLQHPITLHHMLSDQQRIVSVSLGPIAYCKIEYELVGNWYLTLETRAVELPYFISNTWVVALIVGEKNRTTATLASLTLWLVTWGLREQWLHRLATRNTFKFIGMKNNHRLLFIPQAMKG